MVSIDILPHDEINCQQFFQKIFKNFKLFFENLILPPQPCRVFTFLPVLKGFLPSNAKIFFIVFCFFNPKFLKNFNHKSPLECLLYIIRYMNKSYLNLIGQSKICNKILLRQNFICFSCKQKRLICLSLFVFCYP